MALMMDGEEVYRARLAECLAAAEATTLPQVKERHLTAAASWQTLLDTVMERKANVAALQRSRMRHQAEDTALSETEYEIPDTAVDAIEDGTPVMKAFRQSTGRSQHDVAVEAGITEDRLAEIEQGSTAHADELARISNALGVPADLLVDE
ncbi:helix-turn-helix domain-containing protein [Aureimonas pseudogalii]|uniref:Membrane-bound lytic murein transglycosylase B n=1 Tax=Aureimonas pseudogalii TaxID=1744844 RepID=A0A7W6H7S3_9HYPH|nr:helix-turn-helix transcriptional regulator [Aureimonas pseudogalii]MBB4000146.1 membrane-bound lytic murein transglycosylase B [Aureimonas pseudogalii]